MIELSPDESKYIENVKKYIAIEGKTDFTSIPQEEIISTIRKRSKIYAKMQAENNPLLYKIVYQYKGLGENISFDRERELENFGDVLFATLKPYEYAIAGDIYQICYDYMKKSGDISGIIRLIYKRGMSLYYVYNDDSIGDNHFSEVLQYQGAYFSLTDEGRMYFCRAYGNTLVGFPPAYLEDHYTDIMTQGDEILAFFNNPEVRKANPSFPFETWIFATKRNILIVIPVIRKHIETTPQDIKDRLVTYSKEVFEKSALKDNSNVPYLFHYVYSYYCSEFVAGKISLNSLLYRFTEIKNSHSSDKSQDLKNVDWALRQVTVTVYYLDYYATFSKDKPDVKKATIIKIVNETFDFINQSGAFLSYAFFRRGIINFLKVCLNFISFDEIKDRLFSIAITFHQPTYVHSLMVERLTTLLSEALLKDSPEYFAGCGGYLTKEDVIAHKDELLKRIAVAAKFHDLGKYNCLMPISDYYRHLTEDEMEIVRHHPLFGVDDYLNYDRQDFDPILQEVVCAHHVYYNGKEGYPKIEKRPLVNKNIVDIVSVADALDAGTDDIGRSYATAKSLNEIIDDLQSGNGVRYSPKVLALLSEKEVYLEIKKALTVERKNIYIDCYKNIKEG